jgi:hypothetical protein
MREKMIKMITGSAVFLWLFFVSTNGALAVTFTLEQLIAGQTITEGDKTFSNFTFTPSCGGDAFCSPLDPGDINVTGITSNGLIGLQFQSSFLAIGNTNFDILIGYTATVNDPNFLISDIHLAFNGAVIGTNSLTTVTETVRDASDGGIIGQVIVTNPPVNLDETIFLTELVRSVNVLKDIQLNTLFCNTGGVATNCQAQISFIDQLISQQRQVPEPAAMLLFGLGLVGVGVWTKRWSK